MSLQKPFTWSGRTQTGLGLFAASLLYLAVAAPNAVAIAFAVGAGSCLGLYGITGSRFWLTVVTTLMLAVSACGLFVALMLGSYLLLPVTIAQIVAVMLMEGGERRDWIAAATDESTAANGLVTG
jgi:hypothetical protein